MNKPTKSGYYWFRGVVKNTPFMGGDPFPISCPVYVTGAHINDHVSWSGGSCSMSEFEGEWFELTEEKICGSSN